MRFGAPDRYIIINCYREAAFCEPELEGDTGKLDLYGKPGKELGSCFSSVKYKDKSPKIYQACTFSQLAPVF